MARRDYIFTMRYAADNDIDAYDFAEKIRCAISDGIEIEEKLGRYLDVFHVERAMLTRDVVARPLPERL